MLYSQEDGLNFHKRKLNLLKVDDHYVVLYPLDLVKQIVKSSGGFLKCSCCPQFRPELNKP